MKDQKLVSANSGQRNPPLQPPLIFNDVEH